MSKNDLFLICKVASCVASKRFSMLDALFNEISQFNINPVKIYEILLQTYLLCGFPSLIESLKVFRKHFKTFKSNQITYDIQSFKKIGMRNLKNVYKDKSERLLTITDQLSKELSQWMIIEGYGKVMGRKGLSLLEREYVNVTILSTNFYPDQLHSHIYGVLNNGGNCEILETVIQNTTEFN